MVGFLFSGFLKKNLRHNSSLQMCTLIRYLRYMGTFFFLNPSLQVSWMFE